MSMQASALQTLKVRVNLCKLRQHSKYGVDRLTSIVWRMDLIHNNHNRNSMRVIFTVPTTCSRPSIEMVALFTSPCSLSWPHLYIFLAQIWHVALQGPSHDHLHIRFFDPTHCVAVVAHGWFLRN